MTPPWAFMDGRGLAHRRAVGAGHARPRGFPRGGGPHAGSGGSGAPPPRGGAGGGGRAGGGGPPPGAGGGGGGGGPPPRGGGGRAAPPRGLSRGWAAAGGFRGVGDAAPYVGSCPLTGSRAVGCGHTRPTDVIHVSAVGAAYMPPASLCGMPFAGCCFSFNSGLAIRLKMYPRCRAWTFDNRLHPTLFSVRLHLCF